MHRIEMTDIDQRIAKVCDPRTANRIEYVYHNPHTSEQWLVARVLPGDSDRFREALLGQGCEIVIAQTQHSEWNVLRWLHHYRKDAPRDTIASRLAALH